MTVYEHTVPAGLILVALIVAVLAGAFSAWRFMPRKIISIVLAVLYLITLGGLAWCLLLPGKKDAVTQLLKPRFVVALDTSESMTLKPAEATTDRWTVAGQVLKQPWTRVVAADCLVEVFPFSSEVQEAVPLAEAETLKPEGTSSLLRDSLKKISDRFAGLNVAGALVISDGIDTREAFDDWAGDERPFPFFTVRLEPAGEWLKEPDLRIDGVSTSRRVTVNWKTEFKVRVSGQGSRGEPVAVQLFKDDELIAEKPTQIPDEGGERELIFELDHPEVGTFKYRAYVPPLTGEKNDTDNEYIVSIQVIDAKNRLLYVEGIPRWEYKFLRRTLLAQEQVSPAIFYTGPDGSPVGGVEATGLTADMTPAELALFNIVVIGNLDASELGDQRAQNLVKFVEEGGSLVVLGGGKAWAPGGIFQTPLSDILPVRGSGMDVLQAENPFPVGLTDMARGHPAFAGDDEFWMIIPPVLSTFTGSTLSPAAQVLVNVQTPDGTAPLVATQRYGQGKVAVILTDSLWRWQLGPEASRTKPYQRFWTQLVSWLLPQKEDLDENRLDLFADRDQVFLGEQFEIHARLGAEEPPETEGGMQCIVTLPDEREVPYTMTSKQVTTPSGKTFPGFALDFNADTPGLHRAVANAVVEGNTITSEPFSFYVRPYSPETMPRPINTDVLTGIANASGGRFFESLDDLNKGLSALKPTAIEEETSEYETLWRNWPVLIALMGIVTFTWIARKSRNMP